MHVGRGQGAVVDRGPVVGREVKHAGGDRGGRGAGHTDQRACTGRVDPAAVEGGVDVGDGGLDLGGCGRVVGEAGAR